MRLSNIYLACIICLFTGFQFAFGQALYDSESDSKVSDQEGMCYPFRITHKGEIDRVMTIEFDSLSQRAISLLTTYDDGYAYTKHFDIPKSGRYTITDYNGGDLHKKTNFVSLGGGGIYRSTYNQDFNLKEGEEPSIVEFGEISFKKDTILMSGVFHDRSYEGDTTKTEILIRREGNEKHHSREIYSNGELKMLVLYDDYEERFNPISYVESLSLNYLPMHIFKKQTIITYSEGKAQQKTIYKYRVDYNDDLLPTHIEMILGNEIKETWDIEYRCFK